VTEHRLEVADVFRQHGQEFLERWGDVLSRQQRKAFRDISACRTAALGTHLEQCDHCAHQVVAYQSCRNRHCPKCHSRTRDEWLAQRAQEILPVPYCHVVFTLPRELAPLALQNPRVLYGIMFRAVAESLLEMAADPKRLGARLGFLAVLHTWTQRVEHHPHIHGVVPAGGLSPDGQRWISSRKKFFLPVDPLGCLFRGKFLAYLEEAFAAGQLEFYGQLRELAHPVRFQDLLSSLHQKQWVVYAKPPFGGPEQVLRDTPIGWPFPMGGCWAWKTAPYVSAGEIRRMATRSRRCPWMPLNSSAGSCCMFYRAALSKFGISAFCRIATARRWFNTAEHSYYRRRHRPPTLSATNPSAQSAASATFV
jgi:Transposase zinc-binding domain/Putative transposase